MVHHGTIRKYTAALLEFFNDIEITYKLSTGQTIDKHVPLTYSSREKSRILDDYSVEQILSGNKNVLPRANIAFTSMSKAEQRTTNKNNKINGFTSDSAMEFMYNSVPYTFNFDIVIQCRGMNEASQIVEQIVPKFNPTINIDVWDVSNLHEPTRVPVNLLDVSIEDNDYDELSSNIFTVTFGLSLTGNLYPPIKAMPRIKEFQMYLNQIENETDATRKEMMEWDVDLNGYIQDAGMDFYTSGLKVPLRDGTVVQVDPNDIETVLSGTRVRIEDPNEYFDATTLAGILEEIGEKQAEDAVLNDRADVIISKLNATAIIYADGILTDYLLTGDLDRPINKIAYTEYGTGPNDPVAALAYNSIGKISRVDYYLDRSTFNVDGSGRDGYEEFIYNANGKLESSQFKEV